MQEKICKVKHSFETTWCYLYVAFPDPSKECTLYSSPFEACNRTHTCQHTRHWFDTCKKQQPSLLSMIFVFSLLFVSFRHSQLEINVGIFAIPFLEFCLETLKLEHYFHRYFDVLVN